MSRGLVKQFLTEHPCIDDSAINDFDRYRDLLFRWQKAQNLVSRETMDQFWERHILDSVRLIAITGPVGHWLDLGSGAGFPGLVTSILCKASNAAERSSVQLVESNMRKVSFLRAVIRECGLSTKVYNERIESVSKQLDHPVQFISARALAPLGTLFSYVAEYSGSGATCYFHKGREIDGEILEVSNNWTFDLVKYRKAEVFDHPDDGVIIQVKNIRRKEVN